MFETGSHAPTMRGELTSLWPSLAGRAFHALCILTLAVTIALPSVAEAATTITTLNHTNGEVAVGLPHQRKAVRDAGGYWYVTYMDDVGSGWEVFLVKSTNTDGTAWATPVKLAGSSGIIYNTTTDLYGPAIDIDRTNNALHLVFVRAGTAGSQSLCYSKCLDLANWNQASSWYRVDGSTNGYDTVAPTPMHWPPMALTGLPWRSTAQAAPTSST